MTTGTIFSTVIRMEDSSSSHPMDSTTSTGAPSLSSQSEKRRNPLVYLVTLVLFIIGIVLGFFLVQLMPNRTTKMPVAEGMAEITLPTDAQQIQACADHKGALYIQPKNIHPKDEPIGPVYMVNKGKVIGMEFMVAKNDIMQEKSFTDLQGLGMKVDHINVEPESSGHEGFPASHYHLDFYSVSKAVEQAIVCPGSSNDSSSSGTMDMMQMDMNSSTSGMTNTQKSLSPAPTNTMPAKM